MDNESNFTFNVIWRSWIILGLWVTWPGPSSATCTTRFAPIMNRQQQVKKRKYNSFVSAAIARW